MIYGLLAIGIAILLAFKAYASSVSALYVSEGAGFDAGFGVQAEYDQRWDLFGVEASGNFLGQKKHSANSGIKGGVSAQGRGFIGDFYFGVGGAWAGYDSDFDGGANWRKDAFWPVLEVGYNTQLFDAWLTYCLPESQTENESENLKLGASYVLWDHCHTSAELARAEYDQGGKLEDDLMASLAVGWEF